MANERPHADIDYIYIQYAEVLLPFIALTVLEGRQDGHLADKRPPVISNVLPVNKNWIVVVKQKVGPPTMECMKISSWYFVNEKVSRLLLLFCFNRLMECIYIDYVKNA